MILFISILNSVDCTKTIAITDVCFGSETRRRPNASENIFPAFGGVCTNANETSCLRPQRTRSGTAIAVGFPINDDCSVPLADIRIVSICSVKAPPARPLPRANPISRRRPKVNRRDDADLQVGQLGILRHSKYLSKDMSRRAQLKGTESRAQENDGEQGDNRANDRDHHHVEIALFMRQTANRKQRDNGTVVRQAVKGA